MSYSKKKKDLSKKMVKRDIKEEERGEKHYERMAKKHPKSAKAFRSMAKDEERHHEKLENISD